MVDRAELDERRDAKIDEIIEELQTLYTNPKDDECDTTGLIDDVVALDDFAVEDPWAIEDKSMDDLLLASGLNVIASDIHAMAGEKGWWDDASGGVAGDGDNTMDTWLIAQKLLMIHSELSEATEELRDAGDYVDLAVVREEADGKPAGFAVELGDAIIRILDLAAFLDIDIEDVLAQKIAYNASRPYRHGGKNL